MPADAAQEDGPDDLHLRECADYGTPVVRVGPVPFFGEGGDKVCPIWWQGGLPRDDVQCVLGRDVLIEEAVLGSFEHVGWVACEGAIRPPDHGDGAVGGVDHGVVDVADGFVGKFMTRIPLVLLGDALLPVDVPLLQVRPDGGYPRPAVLYVAAGLLGVGVEEGRQVLLRMPEVMEHVYHGRGWLVVLSVGVLLETSGDSGCAHCCD